MVHPSMTYICLLTLFHYFTKFKIGQHAPNAAYPQQTYHPSPVGVHPQQPQQPHVVNNYYGSAPQSSGFIGGSGSPSGGSGPSLLGTALAAGAGSLAGNALYGAFKPDSEHKTVVIHENAAAPTSVPNIAPAAPAAPAVPPAVPPVASEPPPAPCKLRNLKRKKTKKTLSMTH